MTAFFKYLMYVSAFMLSVNTVMASHAYTKYHKHGKRSNGHGTTNSTAPIGVPVISYTPSTNVYSVGTAITTLSPTSSGVSAFGTYSTGTAFGSGNSSPEDVTFDASGNLYVTNVTSNTIRKYNSSGTFVSTFGTGLNQPYNMSFDASGNAYITNYGTNSLIKITSGGVQSTLITGLSSPFGNAVDASGNIYIANYGSSAVQKYSSTGTLLSTITMVGAIDVAVDASNNLYVLSYSVGSITKYNSSGVLQSILTPSVSGLGINNAFGITLDSSGNIYIADSGNNRILEYNSAYTLLNTIATGAGTTPRGVAVDASSNIYATLNATNTVNKYAVNGGYYISPALPAGLSFSNTTGNITGTPIAISAATNYTITAYNASGSASTTINLTVNNTPLPAISYATPQVYTTGTAITTLWPTGTNVAAIGTYGAGTAFGTGNTGPEDIAVDASGNVYVSNLTGSSIRKYSSSGTYLTTLGTGLSAPYSTSFDAAGNAYIVNNGTNTIVKVTTAGAKSTFITGLSNAHGNAIDASGNLYIANTGSSSIQKYNSSGVLQSTIAAPSGLYDLALDASGNIYALSSTTVTIYTSAGTLLSTITPNAAGLGLSSANGVYIDDANNIYIADSGNDRVLEYNQAGTLLANLSTGTGTSPRRMIADANGNLYVTLYTTNTVMKYPPTGGYFINQGLPAGLTFDETTGNISGTPIAASAATNYIVTAYNGTGSATATINITVNAAILNVSNCGSGTVTLTGSGGYPAGGTYNWYATAASTPALQSSTSTTYSPYLLSTTTYYMSYTVGGVESGRTPITATINPVVSSSYSGGVFSYPFNGDATDASGNANTGIVSGATLTADRFGSVNSAYSFNGNSNYIATTTKLTNPNSFTISLWFNTATTTGGNLIGFGTSQTGTNTSEDRNLYMSNTGQLYFGIYTTTYKTISTTASYNDGNWHHVIVTLGTDGSHIYVDGVSKASSNGMTTPTNDAGWWRIGYQNITGWTNAPTSSYFKGVIDDIAVYGRELSSTEISSADDLNQIGVSASSVCPGSPITFTAPNITGATYTWSDAAGNTQTGQTVTFASAVSGNYYLTATTPAGCTSTAQINGLTINPAVASPISGAVLSYPFGGNANDMSGNSDNGIVSGATLTTDRFGATNTAYSFNGTSNYITTSTQITNPTVFTISLWFKTTSTKGGKLIGFGNAQSGASSEDDRNLYMASNGELFFGVYPNTYQTINTTTSYNDGNWHHAVVTFGNDGSTIYVDDQVQASDPTMSVAYVYNGYWRIGYDYMTGWPSAPRSYFFSGTIDDVAVYSRELSSAEIASTDNLTQIGVLTTPICSGSAISFNAPLITGATYTWKDASGNTATGQNPTFSSAVAGNYTLTVTGGPGGCTSTATIAPVLTVLPTSTFTVTPSVDVGANAMVTLGTYNSHSTYTWDFGGGTPSTGTGQGPFNVQWGTSGTKTITLTVTSSSGCFSSGTQTVAVSNTTYGNYAFRRQITLNTASAGITSNLTNFPVLLSIQNSDLVVNANCTDKIYSPTGPNYDFAFVDPSSSTELYYQVESFDPTTGSLLVWVQVPNITYATNNVISFYYGSKSPVVTHNAAFAAKTWPADYQVVFHFGDAAFTGTTNDATANGHIASLAGFQSTDLVTGKIGKAYNFGGNNNMTTTPAPASVAFTLSAWVNINTLGLDQKVITDQGPSGNSSGGYKLGVYIENEAETEDYGNLNRPAPYPNAVAPTPTGPTLSAGTWYHLQGVYNGSSISTYVNGVQYAVMPSTGNTTLNNTLYIGVGEGALFPFNGKIDEPRVSNIAKTGDWIKMEYVDQNDPVSFTSVGSATLTSLTNAVSQQGTLTYSWTGALGTDLAIAANWTNTTTGTRAQLPAFDGSATIVIPSGLLFYPILTSDISFYGLTVANGASLNLNGHTLSVGCNIYNTSGGKINWNGNAASGITWNGSTANQYYYGAATAGTGQTGAMTVNNSASGTVNISSGYLDMYGALTMQQGNLAIAASPVSLTLKSIATQTASVAAVPSNCSIAGNVTVERYITGGSGYRSYRLMSSPVYAATVNSVNVFSINYLQNSVYLTGWAGGGFDKTGNPSIYLYREDQTPSNVTFTSGNFWGISAINNSPTYNYSVNGISTPYNLPVGNGYMLFFRGDRGSSSLASETILGFIPTTVTLSTTGTLNQGAITVHDWYTPTSANIGYTGTGTSGNYTVRGFNLVGNPYASAIDWSTFSSTNSGAGIYGHNVNPTVYLFDPRTKNYATYNAVTDIATGNGTKIIGNGQGFYIQANAVSPSLTFNESSKTTRQLSGPSLLLGAPVAQTAYNSYLRLKLVTDSINFDDMVIGFNSSSSTKYNAREDSEFLPGIGTSGSVSGTSSDSVKVSVKWLPLNKNDNAQVVNLNVTALQSGMYTFERTDFQAIPSIYEVWLMDNLKKDSLDIRNNTTYAFNIDLTDTTTYGSKRFQIVIRENPALSLRLLNFAASKTTNGSEIVWSTENEQNYTNFTVERSTDGGATFNILNGFSSNALGTYSLLDPKPVKGADTYRLKMQDLNGTVSYSNNITLMYGDLSNSLAKNATVSIYPNPAKITLNLNITPAFASTSGTLNPAAVANSVYAITIVNNTGAVIKTATTTQSNWQTDVNGLVPGTYVVHVVNNSNQSVVGSSTFVKL